MTSINQSIVNYTIRNAADVSEETITAGHIKLPVSRTDGKKGKSGICIVVPEISDSVLSLVFSHDAGKEFFTAALDKVRSQIASSLHKNSKLITSDTIGITGILEAIKAQNEATVRFSKEGIAAWFDADMDQLLSDAIMAKLPNISADKLDKLASGYKSDFQLLAAREVMISQEIKIKLEKAMMLLPDDYEHPISERIASKLQNAGTKVVEDVL